MSAAPTADQQRIAYTIKEVAALTGMCERHWREQAAKGRIPARRSGRSWLINARWVESMFDNP